MSSLGETAYVGTLNADTVRYKTLDPALTGFVHNPLNSTLQGAGNDIDLQGGDLTANQINYLTLNPPLPTNGVFTPMVQDLDGGNFNIVNVNQTTATSGVFTNSSLGTAGCGDLTATGTVNGQNLTANQNITATNNITATGAVNANGGLTIQNSLTTSGAGNADFGSWPITTTGNLGGQTLNINAINVGPGGGTLLGNYTLGGDITDGGSSTITAAVMNMTQSFVALTGIFTNNITIGGSISSVGDITSSSGTFNSAFKQVKPFIWDVGTTTNKPSTDSGYILFTTTTGTQLSTNLTLTLPDAIPDYEGRIIEFSGTGMLPDIGAPVVFQLTASYTGQDTTGANPVAETLLIGFNSLTYGRIRCARNSQGRLKWTADP